MAWQASDGRALPPTWRRRIRPAVLSRDGHRCTWTVDGRRCPWVDLTGRTLEVDHIDDPDDHSLGNLRTLCGRGSADNHHGKRTARQGVAARPVRARPRPPHPGLIGDDR